MISWKCNCYSLSQDVHDWMAFKLLLQLENENFYHHPKNNISRFICRLFIGKLDLKQWGGSFAVLQVRRLRETLFSVIIFQVCVFMSTLNIFKLPLLFLRPVILDRIVCFFFFFYLLLLLLLRHYIVCYL